MIEYDNCAFADNIEDHSKFYKTDLADNKQDNHKVIRKEI